MKALVLREYGRFHFEEFPEPVCGRDEVLIRVRACAICGSDVHGMDGSTGRRIPPIVMGHEAAGVIEETGVEAEEAGYRVGDRVTFDSTVSCGGCPYCLSGDVNLCDDRKVLGVSCADYRLHGAFAEFVAVPARILYRLPDAVSFERAAMVEPLSVALHAVRRSMVKPGDAAVVIGAGLIGLLVVQLLKGIGCSPIIAVDLAQTRLDLALRFGADEALRSDGVDVPAAVLAVTGSRGAAVSFECVGLTPTVRMAVAVLRKGGTLTLVGNLAQTVELPLQSVVTRQITLIGSCASAGEYPRCLDLIASGQVDVDSLLSAVAPLSDGDAWFQRLHAAESGLMKVVLVP
jgi:L-iditol 2-dehydrogenase